MKDRIREWWFEVIVERWGWYYHIKLVHIWVVKPSDTALIEDWLSDGYSIEATHLSQDDDTVLYILTKRIKKRYR